MSNDYAGDSYGPFFYDSQQNQTECMVSADPDVAGIGVVLGFVIGALITTVASICATVLDGMLRNDYCILPDWIVSRLPNPKRRRGCQIWRDVLEKLILGFADQQLVTGFALLIAGYLRLYQKSKGSWCYSNAHFYMVIYLACLSSGTHLACLLTLRKYLEEHRTTGSVRIFFIVLFALFLTVAIVQIIVFPTAYYSESTIDWSRSADVVTSVIISLAIAYIYWITIMQSIAPRGTRGRALVNRVFQYPSKKLKSFWRRPFRHQRVFSDDDLEGTPTDTRRALLNRIGGFIVFSNGSTVFLTQVVCSMLSLAFVLVQKFAHVSDDSYYKSLNNKDENSFGFGQIVALVLLTLPVLSALELYLEEKDEEDVEYVHPAGAKEEHAMRER